ncbi:MAG: hypothetical protein F9K22_08310 [Bacteroidetes bacterium]|nr:MAG: hypothetical protein F9K22_08310 [Bacteroidota bacterium]
MNGNVLKYTALSLFAAAAVSGTASAQFINRDEIKNAGGYVNYSGRNYENYSVQFNKRKIYDNFGNFLVDGLSVYELGESQSQFIEPELGGSIVQKSKYYNLWFNNLLIGNDQYGGFQSRIMMGEAIRTKFTSLTFDKARFNGIRWDGATNKYRGTVLASRVSDPVRIRFDASALPNSISRPRDWSVYMFGGHVETDIGDVLTVGATYVNQHQRHSSINSSASSMDGDVANAVPRIIFIRVRDDSPNDLSGPVLYTKPKIIVNGVERPTVNINGRVPSQFNTNLNNPIQYYVFKDFSITERLYTEGATFFEDPILGPVPFNQTSYNSYRYNYGMGPEPSYPLEVRGTGSYTFAFIMPYYSESATFQLLLSNDYALDAAQDWVLQRDEYPTESLNLYPNHSDSTRLGRPTQFFTVERATGNVQDGSNKKWVSYTYGLNTGMALYGLNFTFNWKGFEIEGEYNTSTSYRKYPLLAAPHSSLTGHAFFVRGTKKIGRLTLGGERYRIEPWYGTALDLYMLENSFFSIAGAQGTITYTPPDQYGYTVDDANKTRTDGILPGGAFFALVDDNDDNDRWEDGFYFYNAKPTTAFPRNTDVLNTNSINVNPYSLGYRQNVNELTGLSDIIRKPDTGIFPGKDKDRDGIPDDDRNSNGLPDYTEDFMTFYSDPPSFEAGDDWNNNGVIDVQENDIYPDYPYTPDIDGYHYFASLEAAKNLTFGVGLLREDAIIRGGRNDVNYFKSTYGISSPRLGSVDLYYTFKRTWDDIPNDGFQFSGVIQADPTPAYVRDAVLYRNSLVHTLYIGTRYSQVPNLNIENNVRFELNNRYVVGTPTLDEVEQGTFVDEQFSGSITSLGLVNKIDYTYALLDNRLKLRPQFKIRTLKVVSTSTFDDGSNSTFISTHTQTVLPIFRTDYKLTENTELHFGIQGTKLFGLSDALMVKNRYLRDGVGDFNASTTAVSVTNRTQYSGYNIVIDFGYKVTNYEYQRIEEMKNNTQFSVIYFTIFAGY